jgi:hypothetical protein
VRAKGDQVGNHYHTTRFCRACLSVNVRNSFKKRPVFFAQDRSSCPKRDQVQRSPCFELSDTLSHSEHSLNKKNAKCTSRQRAMLACLGARKHPDSPGRKLWSSLTRVAWVRPSRQMEPILAPEKGETCPAILSTRLPSHTPTLPGVADQQTRRVSERSWDCSIKLYHMIFDFVKVCAHIF